MELVKNIFFNTDKIVEGSTVKISYVGYLFQNGSKDVYLHYGYGENWNNIGEIKTEKTELGYQAEVTIPYGYKTLNLCYKNGSGEWDNNNGSNYIFDVEPCGQNIEEIPKEVATENSAGTVSEVENDIEFGTYSKADIALGAELKPDFNVGNNYTSVGTDSTTANTYNVYDINETISNSSGEFTEIVNTASTNESSSTVGTTENNYLTVTQETGMQMHKGLRKSYIWSKKIKLAIYKIIKYVPKIISGNYKRKVNE